MTLLRLRRLLPVTGRAVLVHHRQASCPPYYAFYSFPAQSTCTHTHLHPVRSTAPAHCTPPGNESARQRLGSSCPLFEPPKGLGLAPPAIEPPLPPRSLVSLSVFLPSSTLLRALMTAAPQATFLLATFS